MIEGQITEGMSY